MKANIAVIGMGQGGMVAAIKLAQAGADVTIYERASREGVSYTWRDDIRMDVFEKVGLPPLPEDAYVQKHNWLFVSPDWQGKWAVPVLKPLEEVSVLRKKLTAYFVDLAEKAGATFRFETPVNDLWVENERIVGVVVDGTSVPYDLVIDASGFFSALRGQVPDKFGVQKEPNPTDSLVGYRAFYNIPDGAVTMDPSISGTMSLRPLGWEGIAWCNHSPDGTCDVLITHMGSLHEAQIEEMLAELKAHHTILGDTLHNSLVVPICLRKGIARPVADGYVALGDSAFMTIPVMGSGIEAAMQGGSIFAKHVLAADTPDFSAKGMWGFYAEYMQVLGKGFAFLDAIRRCALRWEPKVFNWAMKGKFVQYKELAYVMQEKGYGKPRLPLGAFLRTVCMLVCKPSVNKRMIAAVGHGIKALSIASKMPRTYDEKKLAKWQARYDGHTTTLDRVTAKYGQ